MEVAQTEFKRMEPGVYGVSKTRAANALSMVHDILHDRPSV